MTDTEQWFDNVAWGEDEVPELRPKGAWIIHRQLPDGDKEMAIQETEQDCQKYVEKTLTKGEGPDDKRYSFDYVIMQGNHMLDVRWEGAIISRFWWTKSK